MTKFLAALRNVLQGEPLRAIGYGAIAVVFLVTRGLALAGHPFGNTDAGLDTIVIAVGAAVTMVTEFARRFVYSQNTVSEIVDEATADALDGAVEAPVVADPDQK